MDWLLPPPVEVDEALRRVTGLGALAAEILTLRGLGDPQLALSFIDPSHYKPAPPADLPDLPLAARRLHNAIAAHEPILVWGDFDVDGQTSTALLVDALRGLGADVRYHVPHRLKEGHGIRPDVLRGYLDQGLRLVLTCDTGVAAHEAADLAKSSGATLLITDHHALPDTLPDAPAVVNPQRLPPGHPLRDLPGVGVAFKLAQELYALAGRSDEIPRFLDLVALGIVSDVATQHHDTRYLLQLGIDRLRSPQRTGLAALIKSAGVDPLNMSADTIGFQVGPRLNALGRLDDARLAVELLTTEDETYAAQIAAQLEVLNAQRKQVEDQIVASAQDLIARDPSVLNFDALVLGSPYWHAGVIGIVAARLVEQLNKPVILLVAPEEGIARGSARSVPGVDIGKAIAMCADLLLSHGGHPGAAGLSLDALNIPMFRRQLSTAVRQIRDPNAVSGLQIDSLLQPGKVTLDLAEDLDRIGPFGAGNPPVRLLAEGVKLVSPPTTFGLKKTHRHLTLEDHQGNRSVITWWRGAEYPDPPEVFDLVYIPRINDYRGRRSLQLEYVDSRPVPGYEPETGPRFELLDWRAEPSVIDPASLPDALVWAEPPQLDGFAPDQIVTRETARRCRSLIIWTPPPHVEGLTQLLDRAGARTVAVAARSNPDDSVNNFLEKLAGLVRYAQKNYPDGVTVLKIASALSQREVTVRRGLEWLAAKGVIALDWTEDEKVRFTPGGEALPADLEPLQDAIRALLAETRAYRAFFKSADLASLIR